ncbi:MAG: hypothetical protein ACREE6_12965 [Limisphaerales bacterium]
MNYKALPAIFACAGIFLVFSSCKMTKDHAIKSSGDQANAELVAALVHVPVKGPSLGAPVQGLSKNPATEAVVEKGPAIIPTLISALDHSSWSQTVWIVFCLKQMRATEAKERILRLQKEIDNGRFASQPHDLTLQAGIQGYLSAIGSKQSATNKITEHH